MPLIHLEGPDDPRVGDDWRLGDPELVRRRGCFIAEGRLVVARLIERPRYKVRALLLSETARSALQASLARLDPAVPVFVCPAGGFAAVTGFNIHRGCLALVERPPDASLVEILDSARVLIVLEGVTNPDNVGGVFRNAAAFAADAVLLSPAVCDPFYRKATRTSMGATLCVPFARIEPWPEGLECLRTRGFTILALTPHEPAMSLEDCAAAGLGSRFALLVGTEGEGLTPGAARIADARVRIPISPRVDSLNLSVATGIVLSRLFRGT